MECVDLTLFLLDALPFRCFDPEPFDFPEDRVLCISAFIESFSSVNVRPQSIHPIARPTSPIPAFCALTAMSPRHSGYGRAPKVLVAMEYCESRWKFFPLLEGAVCEKVVEPIREICDEAGESGWCA